MFQFADLTDDLNPNQFQQLLHWLWITNNLTNRRTIKEWRRLNHLPID